ncbi:hypothetical protein T492DRAFT_943079, partial [Pavlovales sp. CCMP2436]
MPLPAGQDASGRKRVLPSLSCDPPQSVVPARRGSGADLHWETSLRLDNTPHRGAPLHGVGHRAQLANTPYAPSEDLLRMRLTTPKAKMGALAPLQPLAGAHALPGGGGGGTILVERMPVPPEQRQPRRYNTRARKVRALEMTAPEQRLRDDGDNTMSSREGFARAAMT